MVTELMGEAEEQMKKAIQSLHHQLNTIRTGRASPALVEHIPVEAYDMTMPLNQLAGISVPEARLIVIQPYDKSTMRNIERAIQHSELGINPNNDGQVIRLSIPALTEERRRDLVKVVRTRVEEIKVSIRNHRRDSINDLRQFEQEKLITEDELHRAQEQLQVLTDRYNKEVDRIGAEKEAEVMEV